jgi:hypothetical protein
VILFERQDHKVTLLIDYQSFELALLFFSEMKEADLFDGASQPFEPLFFQFFLFDPFPNIEAESPMAASKEHVGGRPIGSGLVGQYIRNMCEGSDEAPFGSKIMSPKGFELSLIIFEQIDKDNRGSHQQ